jgi:hypothetical protein
VEGDDANIKDVDTGDSLNWGEVFFILHKHCHLNKWDIWNYTIPQIVELMKQANKYIQFEVETRLSPLSIFGGGVSNKEVNNNNYKEEVSTEEVATEEDVMRFAQLLG